MPLVDSERAVRSVTSGENNGQKYLGHNADRSRVRWSLWPAATRYPTVRVYQQIRTAHLERAADFAPASILYKSRRYDFDADLVGPLDVVECSNLEMAKVLARSRVRVLEVNEPLALGGLLRGALAVLAVRATGAARRSRPLVVCYAIENLNPFPARSRSTVRQRSRVALEVQLSKWLARRIDRIAYGTLAAQQLHELLFQDMTAASWLIPALPASCGCLTATATVPRQPRVIFLGALDGRKGVSQLMEAWDLIVEKVPDAHLTIVGKGLHAARVETFVSQRSTATFLHDPERPRIHEQLRQGSVLVLLSQPTPGWREQVGLPIVEGLAHGCHVVTTTETGLSEWLVEHGHQVIAPQSTPETIAAAVIRGLRRPSNEAARITDSLPDVDGRRQADNWLFA